MGQLTADLRYAFRAMLRDRAFSAIAIAALALGIGATTAIFTVVNAVLLQPLPYPQPDRIMRVVRKYPNGTGDSISVPKFMVWRQNHVFDSFALYANSAPSANLGSGDHPDEVKTEHVSREYFGVFGVAPIMGRIFNEAEDLPNGPAAAIVSFRMWQNRLGGDRNIVGRAILLDNRPFNIVGVLPRNFQPEIEGVDVWAPLQADPHSVNQGHYLSVAGRLKPGVTVAQAQAEMKIMGEAFRRTYPQWMDKTESVSVTSMRDSLVGSVKLALMILLGAVGLVLLIACANVANLLLARAASRQRELAIRAAIGASRGRVLRQLLTESVLLAGLGGVCGFILGSVGVRLLLQFAPGNIPRIVDEAGVIQTPPLDWRVAVFTIGVALATGILFGLFPALHTSNPDLASSLKEGGRAGSSRRHNRVRSLLVISEIALALVLLIGSALLIRTFNGLRAVNPGFDPFHMLTLKTSMASGIYATTAKEDNFITQVLQRIEALPGVDAASASILLPLENGADLPFTIEGKPPAKGDRYNGDESWRFITPDYFKAFRIPLMRGRTFTRSDVGNSARVVIINQAMAKKYWPKEDPVGQVIVIGQGLGPEFNDPPRQIVGVVGTVRETGLSEKEPGVMYVPQSQTPEGLTKLANGVIPLAWEIRTKGDPSGIRTAAEREFRAVNPLIPLSAVRPMEEVMSRSLARQDFNMMLLTVFAAIALLLAAIGIYGLMSYSVQQRTQEIGIRLALGGTKPDILRLVVLQGAKMAAFGIVIGLGAAFGLTRFLASLLFGVKATDPWTFVAVAAVLALVALTASFIPARRAAAVEPAHALCRQ